MTTTNKITIEVGSGDDLDVREFTIRQGLSAPFHIEGMAVSRNNDIDFDAVVAKPATFRVDNGTSQREWQGVCELIEQVRSESGELATYAFTIVPRVWLLTQRNNYRIFQMMSELEIVKAILGEWGVTHVARVDPASHKQRKFRAQYDESDFDFINRMMEDAGISYWFEDIGGETTIVLGDAPHSSEASKELPFLDTPPVSGGQYVTALSVTQRARPGKATIGDLDYRKPASAQPRLSSTGGLPEEAALEQFDYEPGAFLYKGSYSGNTPTADDRGASRTDESAGQAKAKNRLEAHRLSGRLVRLTTNALDVAPGMTLNVRQHPHRLTADKLLVREALIEGAQDETFHVRAELVPTDQPVHPELKTKRPKVLGVESATVVGPDGEDIHTDEYGRVRVHFHWDRAGNRDETASCWVPVSQPWSGGGFGGVNIPRTGQEVFVEFLNGNPDRPVVVGRVYTEVETTPYKLPRYKNVASLRSETTPRLVSGGAEGGAASAPQSLLGGGTQLGQQDIASIVTTPGPYQASSPNGIAHAQSGSEISMDDTAGAENLYIQSQRDMNVVVKKAKTEVIGDHHAEQIGTDHSADIGNKEDITVGSDRSITVGGDQTTKIAKAHKLSSNTFEHNVTEASSLTAKTILLKGSEGITITDPKILVLFVQGSTIILLPEGIRIQSKRVDFNP